jgi:catechol-2,3-dioxygenase
LRYKAFPSEADAASRKEDASKQQGVTMLGRLNHVAIAVKDAEKAAKIYAGAFGADISAAVPLPEHGVITVFVTLPNTKI